MKIVYKSYAIFRAIHFKRWNWLKTIIIIKWFQKSIELGSFVNGRRSRRKKRTINERWRGLIQSVCQAFPPTGTFHLHSPSPLSQIYQPLSGSVNTIPSVCTAHLWVRTVVRVWAILLDLSVLNARARGRTPSPSPRLFLFSSGRSPSCFTPTQHLYQGPPPRPVILIALPFQRRSLDNNG